MAKIGFCFSGEGARGAIQAGIALSLAEQGIRPDFTAGISSGSVCAAAYAHLGPHGTAELWANIKHVFSVFRPNWNLLGKSGLMNQKPMEKLVHAAVKNDPICESMVARMHIETGDLDYVSNYKTSREDFAEAVLGAVAITALVQDRKGWVDAGSRQMAPISLCVDEGCTDIYVILGRPLQMQYASKPRGLLQIPAMAFRALDISLFEMVLRDVHEWVGGGNDINERAKNVNITVLQPKAQCYLPTEFRYCSEGVKYGQENYVTYDRQRLLAHFQAAPIQMSPRIR